MEKEFGYKLPKSMHVEFGQVINKLADTLGNELSADQIRETFEDHYLKVYSPFKLISFNKKQRSGVDRAQSIACKADGKPHTVQG